MLEDRACCPEQRMPVTDIPKCWPYVEALSEWATAEWGGTFY